jgi:membrane protease YdiL (CAAX protease family)
VGFQDILNKVKKVVTVQDTEYEQCSRAFQAKTPGARAFYLLAYLIPGMAAFLLINITPVYRFLSDSLGFRGYNFQYFMFLVFTLGWHLSFPLLMLRFHERLPWKQVFAFLSLRHFSAKEIFVVAPIAFVASVVLSLPYMTTVYNKVQDWFNAIPAIRIPAHSIFASYQAFYGAPLPIMAAMLIGNFVGEEVYFRGYLMKKTAFLGKFNWLVNSILFCAYHLWQIPQSWPLIVPFLFFGLVMQLRKNLYTMITFHLLFNIGGVQVYHVLLHL